MRDVHTIRLRGPWQIEPIARYVALGDGQFKASVENLPPATKDKMPADWSAALGSDFRGRVRYTRRFHEPAGLEELEEVWLAVAPQCSRATIALNGHSLGEVLRGEAVARSEITALLRDTNVLEIIVDHPRLDATGKTMESCLTERAGGLTGEVWLEIGFP